MNFRFKCSILNFILLFIALFVLNSGNAAKIYFNDVYKGTGTNYAEQTNSISSIQFITGSGFTFTSTDPADVTFRLTGNNVAGTLSYINGSGVKQSIIGQVSRQDKNGNNTIGLYFYTTTNEAFLLVIPGITSYSSNSNISTSSDPILAVMNDVLTAQNSQPKISINDVTVNASDPFAVFTVSLSSAANANISFTPTLNAVTAVLGTDYTASMQYYNGSSWVNISGVISITQGTISLQIRVPILNAGATENRTFNLNSGAITGGNILNNDGAYGIGTIVPTPAITTSGTLKTFSVCSSYTLAPQAITVAGTNLSANIELTAPTGYEISTSSSSGYSSTVTLIQSNGVVSSTSVFIKTLISNTIAGTSTLTISSTGASTQSISLVANGDNTLSFVGNGSSSGSYISLPANVVNGFTNFSFESWVYPTSSAYWQRIFDFGKTSSTGYLFFTTNNGVNTKPRFGFLPSSGSGEQMVDASSNLQLNTWSHIALVLDASAQTATIYINGQVSGSGNITLNPSSLGTITNAYLGKSFYVDPYFNGKMDEVRIWNTARTSNEIANNYQKELSGNETGLVAYYDFNQGIANGTNTGLTSLIDKTSNNYNGTLNTFNLTGTSSNWVAGLLPAITATGNATTLIVGNTLQLSNSFTGGEWSSANTAMATINASTGLVTGVGTGVVTITYSACSKSTTYILTVVAPTLTVSSLKTFTSCSGCSIPAQSFTVSGENLIANITLTAPAGFEMATTSNGSYTSTISLTQSGGTVTTTTLYTRLINSATTASSGNITVASTGATSKTITATVNTDNGLHFDGVDDYVSIADNNVLDITSNITIEAWVKPASGTNIQNVISKSTSAYNNSYIFPRTDNNWTSFNTYLNLGGSWVTVTSPYPNDGKYHHLAMTYNGSNIKLYLDGTLVATRAATGSISINTNSLIIGNQNGFNNERYTGSVDEIRIWNIERSQSEISSNLNVELKGDESGLVVYYNFNQGVASGANSSINTITDKSTNNFTGTLTNFAKSGTSSNFVIGFIPAISAAGNATSLPISATLQLSNSLSGGTWASSNTSIATVNASTGLVTGVTAGSVSITYSICDKSVGYGLTIITPTLTVSNLKTFASCSGCSIPAQSFTVSGVNLTNNITVTAPTGFEMATASNGSYTSTISLTQSGGTVTTTTLYARLINSITTGSSGLFTVASTGATSKTITATVNTDNGLDFNGTNSINLGNAAFRYTTNFTIESWVKLPLSYQSSINTIASNTITSLGNNGIMFGINDWATSNLKLVFEYTGGAVSSSIPITAGVWNHVAVVISGTSATFYINGQTAGTYNNLNIINDPTQNLYLGSMEGSYYKFKGQMDNLRFWNINKTQSEIQSLMLQDTKGNEANLVISYDFNQGIINGTNTSITNVFDQTSNAFNATISGFTRTGASSNFVAGFIPAITAANNTNNLILGNTLQLSNIMAGGVWSSSNTGLATINPSTGLVTSLAVGSVVLSYTICDKVTTYNLNIVKQTLTVSTIKNFASCSGCNIPAQTFTVSGVYLTNDITITAPSGFELATASNGTFTSTLTLTPSSGTVATTTLYAKLINNTTTANTGAITVVSTGADAKTITATVNTDNALNFDGVNDYTLTTISGTALTAFTIEAYIKPSNTTQTNVGVLQWANTLSSANPMILYKQNGTTLSIYVNSNYNLSTTLTANTWSHIALVYTNSLYTLYVNGVASATYAGGIGFQSNGTKLYLGNGYNGYWNGDFDEVRIWNVARTSAEIQNNYLTELLGTETGLIAYYNFNQGATNGTNTSISFLTDKTLNAKNGTFNNMALTGNASNFVAGFIPDIAGTSSIQNGSTTTLTNSLTGGSWSSAATQIATVNASTGLVTGIAQGTSTITYSICDKTVSKIITIVGPTISASAAFSSFTTCQSTASAAQTFIVSAQYLTTNLVLTAPSGYEMSLTSGGTYSSTLNITPSSGTVNATNIYIRLSATAINGASGNISMTSTGATTVNLATGIGTVNLNKTASVSISSNISSNSFCSGTSITFTATPTNGGTAPTYQWKKNGVAINGATNNTYTTTGLANNDVITVVMVSNIPSCLNGSPATSNGITVEVISVPASPGNINGQSGICMNANQVYSVTAVPGATNYSWVVTGGLIASASTNNIINITATNNAGSGTIKVAATNNCGTSAYSNILNVTISNIPAPTAAFSSSASAVCISNATVNLTNSSTVNATTQAVITSYTWDFGDGSSTVSTANASRTYIASGNYDVIMSIADANQCNASYATRITVDPTAVAGTAAAVNTIICAGANTILNLTGYTGTIQWQSSTDGIIFSNINGATSANYTTANLSTTTYYKALVSSGTCSAVSSGVVTVTVSPIPSVTLVAVSNINEVATSFDLTYTNTIGSPDNFSLVAGTSNVMPNFVAINGDNLIASPITITIPASASGTYNFNLTVDNNQVGCSSSLIPFTITIVPQAPASLSYTTPNVYTVGTTITALNPSSTGGAITNYTISPALSGGLSINPTTGIISGTPSVTAAQTAYIVTGTNASGTVTATVVITVNVAAPASLSYTTPNVYTVGTTITALNPSSTGGAITNYTISPALSGGLSINPTTGIISGTPSVTAAQTAYIVTGTNASGTVTATVVITVNVAAPASLSYTTPNVYTVGTTITALNPSSTGGAITNYTISPALSGGLSINPTTGIISGTPTVTAAQTAYTVTGTNASGTVTATVVITVNVAAPASLSYTTPNVYTVGTTITALNPSSTGGAITNYTISPALSGGLSINPTTGIISGTPTVTAAQTSYIVTGTNASGTVTATVVITVNVAAPASLSYTTPNVYTVGTTITALNPSSTGGAITNYTISPALSGGLSINPTTGIISGTPTVTAAQTSYIVTGTNISGTVTATVVITVNTNVIPSPQGSLYAVDNNLLAADTVKLKLTISNGTAPFTLILANSINAIKDTITNLSPVNNEIVFEQKRLDTTKIFTIFKLIDANNNTRTAGFTKDTTIVQVLRPNIALTLKADRAKLQPDNSFKTKLLLKIKNTGEINLRNIQVNANLSNVFPVGLNYILDSVKVVSGNLLLSSNYQGNGTSTTASSVHTGFSATSGIVANAVLDANYLLDNGNNLAINEEGDVNFYISIAPTTSNVNLKLQFISAGDGVLVKNDGSSSQQASTARSDNGTNLTTHPNNTNIGTPLPTYLPLFPVEIIGAALKASNPTPVQGGYTFDFVAKAKNFSNMNLDTVGIFNDLSKTFTNPDTAYIVGTPVVTGNAVYNTHYNGYTDTLLIDSTAKLSVGDSITVSYKLFVGTTKTSASWSNAIYASGHASIDYNYVWDISTDGTNPDPNGDANPKEAGKTYFYINFTPPAPPTVDNKTYVYGTTIPSTIAGLVTSYPIGTIPVWCDVQTTICSPIAPSTPTIIGKYVYQLKSYDTTTKLYSISYVNDTVVIKPPVPQVKDSIYIIGNIANPANVGVQVVAMTGGVLKYYYNAGLLSNVPVLGTTAGSTRYTTSQMVNQIESDTVGFKVTMLHSNEVLHLQKIAGEAVLQSNSTFNIPFTFIARNVLNKQLDSVLITDNLLNAVLMPSSFTIVSISSSGSLVSNVNFNGKTDIALTTYASKLTAGAIDTIKLVINVAPNGFAGALQNTAIANARSPYGKLTIHSSSNAWTANESSKVPTTFTIPDLRIDIPEGFSPNRDGVNDKFVIIKPYGMLLDLEVYNRWGNVVYSNSNYNNEWDGKGTNNFIGQDLMDGGYYYTLKAKSVNGTVQIFKGFVLIQR